MSHFDIDIGQAIPLGDKQIRRCDALIGEEIDQLKDSLDTLTKFFVPLYRIPPKNLDRCLTDYANGIDSITVMNRMVALAESMQMAERDHGPEFSESQLQDAQLFIMPGNKKVGTELYLEAKSVIMSCKGGKGEEMNQQLAKMFEVHSRDHQVLESVDTVFGLGFYRKSNTPTIKKEILAAGDMVREKDTRESREALERVIAKNHRVIMSLYDGHPLKCSDYLECFKGRGGEDTEYIRQYCSPDIKGYLKYLADYMPYTAEYNAKEVCD